MSGRFAVNVGFVGYVDDDLWQVSVPAGYGGDLYIAGDESTGVPHDQALAALDAFIAEIQAARQALVDRRPQAGEGSAWVAGRRKGSLPRCSGRRTR